LALLGRFDRHFTALWDGGHIKFFSVKTLKKLLNDSGFKDIKVFTAGRFPPFSKSMIFLARKPE
jgi:2-polyprenyl-6-hydroxyphenyl methylase/3-demethylubiquinone-9 3-methyltransferase